KHRAADTADALNGLKITRIPNIIQYFRVSFYRKDNLRLNASAGRKTGWQYKRNTASSNGCLTSLRPEL
ncbi:MAG: hypothetical protein WB818_12450, partial [Desulfobacterales bacterium]